jgi:tRNA U34 5-methylaminomethyl-2-thiouridine-forming methyltransferase MnmC
MQRKIIITNDGSNSIEISGTNKSYRSKGEVKRTVRAAGFIIEKLQGPPGKREMIRAIKMDRKEIKPG